MTPTLSQGAKIADDKLREIVDDIGTPTGLTIDVSDGFLHSICIELLAAREALAARIVPEKPTHRHVKRGSEYVLIGFGKMQAERWNDGASSVNDYDSGPHSVDMREVAVYRSVDDGSLWVRPREEFEDGRFEALAASPTPNVPPQENEGVEYKPFTAPLYASPPASPATAGAGETDWNEVDAVERMIATLHEKPRFPSTSLSIAGGVDTWRDIMRNALRAAAPADKSRVERLETALEACRDAFKSFAFDSDRHPELALAKRLTRQALGDRSWTTLDQKAREAAIAAVRPTLWERNAATVADTAINAYLNALSSLPEQAVTEAEPFLTGRGWENLTCDDQFALARKIAANVGYMLVAEPSISEAEDRADDAARPSGDGVQAGRAEVIDLATIEATARKINPGRSEDHIKSVALDALSIFRALNGGKNG